MLNSKGPIGVIDSGVGGLTVAREIQKMLPGEDILYFGDSANCPYGNKTGEEITGLSVKMLRFLGGRGVKVVAIACNTISTLVETLGPKFDFRIIGIIEPAAKSVVRSGLKKVGLIATEFTVSSGAYEKLIHKFDPSVEVIGKGSPLLAGMIDGGDFGSKAVDAEIKTEVNNILSRGQVQHVILGCTHYPIVEDSFRRCYPDIQFINPAVEQANAVHSYLAENNALSSQKSGGSFSICTSGDPQVYANVAKRIGMSDPTSLEKIAL